MENWGCGTYDGFHGGDPLWVVDHFDDVDWCGLTSCRVSPGEDVWMGTVAVVRRVDVMVVAVEARWLGDFVYLPVCRVSNTIALGSNVWVGALMASTESTPGISVFQMKVQEVAWCADCWCSGCDGGRYDGGFDILGPVK